MKSNIQELLPAKICIDNGQIILTEGGKVIVQIPVCNLKLIGKYMTANGPFSDDWVIVFMNSKDDWKQISEYTPGMQEVLSAIGAQLNAKIVCSLFASTSWKTNIIWPESIAGQEMWHTEAKKPTTLFGKLKRAMGMDNQILILTPAAVSAFS